MHYKNSERFKYESYVFQQDYPLHEQRIVGERLNLRDKLY